ncbi:hypothetical protein [Alkalibaculum bacchi]|nr:hypothetical protein [Alkalibaculum bacchi]
MSQVLEFGQINIAFERGYLMHYKIFHYFFMMVEKRGSNLNLQTGYYAF